ncbi:hypothetical protein D5078_18910 [Pectobacterium carotovorum]|nr:hypothetical protein D5078_18910 [Pectobacterium carotovorum]
MSSLTPVTYLCKLPGTPCVAAFLQLELFRVYIHRFHCMGYQPPRGERKWIKTVSFVDRLCYP